MAYQGHNLHSFKCCERCRGMPNWSDRQQLFFIVTLRILGFAVGGVVAALGLYYLISGIDTTGSSTTVVKNVVLDVYRIIFGLLIIVAEMRPLACSKYLLVCFSFMLYYIGLGFFYVFVGGFALGSNWYEYVVTVVAVCVGFLYCAMGCCCSDLEKRHQDDLKPAVQSMAM